MSQRFNENMNARHDASANRIDRNFSKDSNAKSRSQRNGYANQPDHSSNAQASAISSATNNANVSSIWEPRK